MKAAEERLTWLRTFVPLYEKAAPIVSQITNLEMLAAGELPVNPYTLAVSNLTLRPILEAVRRLREPKEQEYSGIQREFEIALSSSIKAASAAEKYIELRDDGIDGQAQLSTVISSMVLAHEYMESVAKKMAVLKGEASDLDAVSSLGLRPPRTGSEKRKAPGKGTVPPAGPQLAIDNDSHSHGG